MAGTVTILESYFGDVAKLKWAWTSSAGGAADLESALSYYGEVLHALFDPGATAPTDDYDATIVDEEGYDVLQGGGANRDTANNEVVVPTARSLAFGKLTLHITNAGNAKNGVVILYVKGLRLP